MPSSRAERLVLIPALPAIALMVLWVADGGGYDPTVWYPLTLFVLALLAATVAGLGISHISISRPTQLALGAFALYVVWSYASIAWAGNPGDALDGSNRALLYLMLFALFTLLPWEPRSARIALTAFVVGVGVVALITAARIALGGASAHSMFIDGRLASPLGYQNADAAMFTLTALLAVGLASMRESALVVRGVLAGIATLCLALAVLAESRGWLFTLPIVVVLWLLGSTSRLRLSLWAIIPAALTLALTPSLLHAYKAAGTLQGIPAERAVAGVAAGPVRLALLLAVVAAVAGGLLALADRRVVPRRRTMRAVRRALAALGVLAVIAGVATAAVADAPHTVSHWWSQFRHDTPENTQSSRFVQLGSGRYDFWRVSLIELRDHPIGGLGQDNFSDAYLLRRRTTEEPRWTHGLLFRLLAHTGLVGFALFLAFAIAALVAALRERKLAEPGRRALAGVALGAVILWAVHGSVDWFWEFPALSGPALGFLGLAGALMRPPGDRLPIAPRFPRLAVTAAIGTAIAALIVLVPPYVAQLELARAQAASDPVSALRSADLAADIDPLSADSSLIGGAVALRAGRFADAARELRRALDRDPHSWLANFELGLVASAQGQPAAARAKFDVAHVLNPREAVLAEALSRVDSTSPMTYAQAATELQERALVLVGGQTVP